MSMEDTDDEIEQHPWVQASKQVVDQFTEPMEQAAQRGDVQAVLLLSDGQAKAVWNLTLARGYLRYLKERLSFNELLGDLQVDL